MLTENELFKKLFGVDKPEDPEKLTELLNADWEQYRTITAGSDLDFSTLTPRHIYASLKYPDFTPPQTWIEIMYTAAFSAQNTDNLEVFEVLDAPLTQKAITSFFRTTFDAFKNAITSSRIEEANQLNHLLNARFLYPSKSSKYNFAVDPDELDKLFIDASEQTKVDKKVLFKLFDSYSFLGEEDRGPRIGSGKTSPRATAVVSVLQKALAKDTLDDLESLTKAGFSNFLLKVVGHDQTALKKLSESELILNTLQKALKDNSLSNVETLVKAGLLTLLDDNELKILADKVLHLPITDSMSGLYVSQIVTYASLSPHRLKIFAAHVLSHDAVNTDIIRILYPCLLPEHSTKTDWNTFERCYKKNPLPDIQNNEDSRKKMADIFQAMKHVQILRDSKMIAKGVDAMILGNDFRAVLFNMTRDLINDDSTHVKENDAEITRLWKKGYNAFDRKTSLRVAYNALVAIGCILIPLAIPVAVYYAWKETKANNKFGLFALSTEQRQLNKIKDNLGEKPAPDDNSGNKPQ